jgi:Multicopper oxidase
MTSPINRREFVALSVGVVAGAARTCATSRHDSASNPIPHFDAPDRRASVASRGGRYLLHCHKLEHEDHSMMARFDVV